MKISTFDKSNNTTFADAAILDVVLERQADTPLFEQLVQALRQIILSGRLGAGSKLPSTRKFANELSVSRVTIVTAYDQLTAEGYIESRHGAGAFVVDGLPEEVSQVAKPLTAITPGNSFMPSNSFTPSNGGTRMPEALKPFQPTSPDMRLFPHKQWAKLLQRVWSDPHASLLANADPLGWWPLRQQISEHLRVWRGINCQPEQVIITSGASEAMQTIADGLLKPGQTVAREEPGYTLFSRVLQRSQIGVQAVPVDDQGMSVDALANLSPQPRCAITTPSRQYPLGITMPLARRLQLLGWGGKQERFIIEDDYDSEYRYVGQPLPALMSLAEDGTVIYLGSFSKVFSKSLRLGYMVVPQHSLSQISRAIEQNGPNAAGLAQPVLAQFMASGAYASHIRRMRRTYASRQKTFVGASQQHLAGLIEFEMAGGGMHLVGKLGSKLTDRMSDVEICHRARKAGVVLVPLSENYSKTGVVSPHQQGLIAGYAGFNDEELRAGVQRLAVTLSL